MTPVPVLIKSERGCDLLSLENHPFSKTKELKSGEVYWRCSKKNLKCPAKVFTIGPDLTISRSDLQHNHEADIRKLHSKIISNACKRKAEEDISEKPSKVIRKHLSTNLPEALTFSDVNNIRKNIYNCRRKILPSALPKNMEEVHRVVQAYSRATSKGESFLFINCPENNIIVFSCESNIKTLCKMSTLYMDGTFSHCTKHFFQLFTIHGLQNGYYMPLLYCLLPNKSTETYKNLFLLLKTNISDRYELYFEPCKIFVDFEIAIHKAIDSVWPNVNINGCRFHLHQAWFRKIKSLGLETHYKNLDSEVGKWLRHTFGLTYLNPQEVEDCFVFDLMSYKPENTFVDQYADYLIEMYVGDNAIFPPYIWADNLPSLIRTTNACESFHSQFNYTFYSTHPSIYIFIDKLKEFQIDTYLKIQSLHIPVKIKDKDVKNKLKFLESATENYNLRNLSRLEFVKCTSYHSSTM